MPDDVEIPEAVAAVYRAWWTAQADVAAYEAAVTAQRLEQFPNPDGRWNEEAALKRRQWEPEQVAELERLRRVREDAFQAMAAHHLVAQAQVEKTWKGISATLQKRMLADQDGPQA